MAQSGGEEDKYVSASSSRHESVDRDGDRRCISHISSVLSKFDNQDDGMYYGTLQRSVKSDSKQELVEEQSYGCTVESKNELRVANPMAFNNQLSGNSLDPEILETDFDQSIHGTKSSADHQVAAVASINQPRIERKHITISPRQDSGSLVEPQAGSGLHGISHDFFCQIMGHVHDLIADRKYSRRDLHNLEQDGTQTAVSPCQYLINEGQIKRIVERVVLEVCRNRLEDDEQVIQEAAAEHVPELQPQTLMRKPSFLTNAIELQASGAVQPATTLVMPQIALFSKYPNDGGFFAKTRGPQVSKTAIFSPRSTADMRWLTNGEASDTQEGSLPESSTTPFISLSECSSPRFATSTVVGGVSWNSITSNNFSADLEAFLSAQANEHVRDQKENPRPGSSKDTSSIISFPALPERHCTNDWMSDPVDLAKSVVDETDDLYHLGVDARSGNVVPVPTIHAQEPVQFRHCNQEIFRADIFPQVTLPVGNRRATEASINRSEIALTPKLGASIGSASHRRRSAQVHSGQHPLQSDYPGSNEVGLIEKFRSGSKHIAKKLNTVFVHHPPSQRSTRRHPTVASDEDLGETKEDSYLSNSLDSRLTGASGNHDPGYLAALDRAGVCQAKTGSRQKDRNSRATCSEDYHEHLCDDDTSSGL